MVSQEIITLLKKARDLNKTQFSEAEMYDEGISIQTIDRAKGFKYIQGSSGSYEMTSQGFFTLTQHELNEYAKALQENTTRLNDIISKLQASTDKYSRTIIGLTVVMVILAVIQVCLLIW